MTDLSARKLLVPFLFTVNDAGRSDWYGVSAYSLEDALSLLHNVGFEIDPSDPAVTVRESVQLTEFEERHIGPNRGPMQLRGVWYPRRNLT
jgi:hypothetical protein